MDPSREKPVYFSWRLRNWPIPEDVCKRIHLIFEEKGTLKWEIQEDGTPHKGQPWSLTEVAPPHVPQSSPSGGLRQRSFTPRLDINFERKSARARTLGELGERLVVAFEKKRLAARGMKELAARVSHVAKERGDGAGYDVLSFSDDGGQLFIEVKTTTGGPDTDFLITANEIAFSSKFANQYRLYRLFHFSEVEMTAELYVLPGDMAALLPLLPTEYRVSGLRAAKT